MDLSYSWVALHNSNTYSFSPTHSCVLLLSYILLYVIDLTIQLYTNCFYVIAFENKLQKKGEEISNYTILYNCIIVFISNFFWVVLNYCLRSLAFWLMIFLKYSYKVHLLGMNFLFFIIVNYFTTIWKKFFKIHES